MAAFGVFVGNDPNEARKFETWAKNDLDFVSGHGNGSSWSALTSGIGYTASQFKDIAPVHWTIPMLVSGGTLSQGAGGAYNANYRTVAQKLVEVSPGQDKIYVRFGQEFNGNWFAWGAKGQEAAYIATYRHFVDAFRSVSNKFVFEWNVNAGDMGMDPAKAYPGDAYVDVIGMDFYYNTTWYPKDPAVAWDFMVNRTYGLQWLENFASAHNKPTAYPEWGVNSDNAGIYIQKAAQWFESQGALYQSYWNSNADFPGKLSDGQYPATGAAFVQTFAETTVAPAPSGIVAPQDSGAWQSWIGGGAGDDWLNGDSRNNKIDGGGGADTMSGAGGDDSYTVDRSNDVVVEKAGEGVDKVDSYASSYALGANVEHLVLVGNFAQSGYGNGLANRIVGGAGANVIEGRGGADWLTGGGSRDVFVFKPGSGSDVIVDFDRTDWDADRIDLDAFGFTSFSQVKALARDVSGGLTIDLPGADDLRLLNVTVAQLTADHFIL
jgi:Ca2+-binding RTX toxin-like protein